MGLTFRASSSDIRHAILFHLKKAGPSTINELAKIQAVSFEAIRQQMAILEREGWVKPQMERNPERRVGRPTRRYSLTVAGDHLFPKKYDQLAKDLIGSLSEHLGPQALKKILAILTEVQVRKLEPLLQGKSFTERLELLKNFYFENDPFIRVETGPQGTRLIEQNCPFYYVVKEYPFLCSVTVSSLARLLGVRVVKEEGISEGGTRCVFRILEDQPIDPKTFKFEFRNPTKKS